MQLNISLMITTFISSQIKDIVKLQSFKFSFFPLLFC